MSEIRMNSAARAGIKEGIDEVVAVVAMTAGPKGKNVIIDRGYGASEITNDGVTVARSISFDDPVKNMGAHMVKEVATNTEEVSGDGTSTSSILFQSLVDQGEKYILAGADANRIKVGMDNSVKFVNEYLDSISRPLKDNGMILKIATISTNNDPDLASYIAEAFHLAGTEGVVGVADSNDFNTYTDLVEGVRFDRGFLSQFFITNRQTGRAEITDAKVLVTSQKITTPRSLLTLFEEVGSNTPVVIICDDVDDLALKTLVEARFEGQANITLIKAPGFGDSRFDMLEDIATIVGATLVSDAHKLDEVGESFLGSCEKVIASRDETTIIGGFGEESAIDDRIQNIKTQLEDSSLEEYPRTIMEKRLATLTGGVATLYLGASSDTELTEKKRRVEDAIGAIRSAIEQGIIGGGGTGLMLASKVLLSSHLCEGTTDEVLGAKIVADAIKRPFEQIITNAGLVPGIIEDKINSKGKGYNVKTDEWGDLFKMGVVDPVKVTKTALMNASSVAGLFLSANATVYNKID